MGLGSKLRETKGLCCAFGRPPKITGVVPSGPPVMKPLEALVWALRGRYRCEALGGIGAGPQRYRCGPSEVLVCGPQRRW